MSGASDRAAARIAARRGAGATTSGRPSSSSRSTLKRAGSPVARPSLTGRAVILATVVGLVVFTLAVPLQMLIRQRAQIASLQAANDATAARVTDLQQRQQRLQDPAYVTSLIRERLHYVLPGEIGYVVLDPSEAPAPAPAKGPGATIPWYSTLWHAVQTTDQASVPAPVPGFTIRPDAPR